MVFYCSNSYLQVSKLRNISIKMNLGTYPPLYFVTYICVYICTYIYMCVCVIQTSYIPQFDLSQRMSISRTKRWIHSSKWRSNAWRRRNAPLDAEDPLDPRGITGGAEERLPELGKTMENAGYPLGEPWKNHGKWWLIRTWLVLFFAAPRILEGSKNRNGLVYHGIPIKLPLSISNGENDD